MTQRHREEVTPDLYSDHTLLRYGKVHHRLGCLISSYSKVMDDVVTPDFARKMSHGEVVNNPCRLEVESTTSGGGSTRYIENSTGYTVYEGDGGSQTYYQSCNLGEAANLRNLPDTPDLSDALARVKMKAIANIDSTPASMLEDVAEIRETLRFLKSPLTSLAGLAKRFRNDVKKRSSRMAKVKHYVGASKDISDVWLTYRFAATPLVQSSLDAYRALTETQATLPERKTARNSVKDHSVVNAQPRVYYTPTIWDVYEHDQAVISAVRAGILYQVSNPVSDIQFKLGLRAKDIPETLWAVLPYSFVVDRMVDISSGIRALTNLADPNVEILAGWTTMKLERETRLKFVSEVNPGWTVIVNGDDFIKRSFVYDRTPWTPTVLDAWPRLNVAGLVDDAKSIADLCSLVIQRLSF